MTITKMTTTKTTMTLPKNYLATSQRLNLPKQQQLCSDNRLNGKYWFFFLGFNFTIWIPPVEIWQAKIKMRGVAIEELMVGWFKRFSLLTNHLNNGCGRQSLLALTDRTLNSRFSNCSNLSSSTLVHCCTIFHLRSGLWNRWSIQIPKGQYRDHLVGQLTTRCQSLHYLSGEPRFKKKFNIQIKFFCHCFGVPFPKMLIFKTSSGIFFSLF